MQHLGERLPSSAPPAARQPGRGAAIRVAMARGRLWRVPGGRTAARQSSMRCAHDGCSVTRHPRRSSARQDRKPAAPHLRGFAQPARPRPSSYSETARGRGARRPAPRARGLPQKAAHMKLEQRFKVGAWFPSGRRPTSMSLSGCGRPDTAVRVPRSRRWLGLTDPAVAGSPRRARSTARPSTARRAASSVQRPSWDAFCQARIFSLGRTGTESDT